MTIILSYLTNLPFLAMAAVFFLWLTARTLASEDTRRAMVLKLLLLANLGNPIVDGFSFLSFETPLGDLNAMFTWVLLFMAIFETVLIKNKNCFSKIQKRSISIVLSSWCFAFFLLYWQGNSIAPYVFYIPVTLLIFRIASPSAVDAQELSPILISILSILFLTALVGYQAPVAGTSEREYLVEASKGYSNSVWNVFSSSERYRGPYSHPNAAGINIGFISLLLFMSKGVISKVSSLLGFILLALCVSRVSIFSTVIAIAIFTFAKSNKRMKSFTIDSTRNLLLGGSVFALFGSGLIAANPTFTGRTLNWRRAFESWKDSPVLGKGFVGTVTENSYITILLMMGLVGICLLLFIFIGALMANSNQPHH
jgi:hypothetical protein